MLRVNNTQYAALEAHYAEEFVQQMTRRLFKSFPDECKQQGRNAIADFTRESVHRARGPAIGATIESDFQRYVVVEFVLGIDEAKQIANEERARLVDRDGKADPTLLIFQMYQAMQAKIMPEPPPPPPDLEYEVVE